MALLDPQYPKRLPALLGRGLKGTEIPLEFSSIDEVSDLLIRILQNVMCFCTSMFPGTFTFTGFLRLDFMVQIPLEHVPVKFLHLAELEAWRSAIDPILEASLQADATGEKDNKRFCVASLELMHLTGYVTTWMMRTDDGHYPDTMAMMPQFEKK